MTWRESFGPLRERNFRAYFAARTVNTLGTTMATVALAFAVLHVTDDDATALGKVLTAHTVPMIVLMLWGGVLADRFPRERVIQWSNLTSAVSQGVLAVLVITDTAELWMLIVLSAVHGTVSAASLPALASIMPTLVPGEQLQRANALVSMSRGALTVVGPTLGALLVVGFGPGWALAVDAACWLVSAAFMVAVRLHRSPPPDAGESTLAQLAAGWDYVRHTTWLWVVVAGFGALNLIHSGAWFTLGPLVAKRTVGEEGWGLVLSAEAVGLLLMTAVMLRITLQRPLFYGMLGVSLMATPLLVLGLSPTLPALVTAALLAGAGIEVFSIGWYLAMQEHVPEHMLSRVFSYDMLGSFIAMPLGQLAYGPLAVAFGFREVLVVSGLAYLALCGLVLCSSSVRRLPRRIVADPVS